MNPVQNQKSKIGPSRCGVTLIIWFGIINPCNADEDPFFPIMGLNQLQYQVTSYLSLPHEDSRYLETISANLNLSPTSFERKIISKGIKEAYVQGQIYPSDISTEVMDTCQTQYPFNCTSSPLPYSGEKGSRNYSFMGDSTRLFTYEGDEYLFSKIWNSFDGITSKRRERIFKRSTGVIFDYGEWTSSDNSYLKRTRKVLVSQNGALFDSTLAQTLYDYVNALPRDVIGIRPKKSATSPIENLWLGAAFDVNGRVIIAPPSLYRIRVRLPSAR
jgi:hypothetical protein